MEKSLAHLVAGIAVAEETADCWDIVEIYLVSQRVDAERAVGVVVVGKSVVAARKDLAVDRTPVDMKGKRHYQEEHHTVLAAVDSLESSHAGHTVSTKP